MLIDSHTHLGALKKPLPVVMKECDDAHVTAVINVATELVTLEFGKNACTIYPNIFLAAAVHPHDASNYDEKYFEQIQNLAENKKLIAIGESGLDYFYTHSEASIQKVLLRKHLRLASVTKLPLIIHCRDAFSDFFAILDEEKKKYELPKIVLHCFTGTLDEMNELLARDIYVSFSGIITFPKSEALRICVEKAPLERILVETDAPYLAPIPKRGKDNEPAFVVYTAQKMSEIKGCSFDTICTYTYKNTIKFFNLEEYGFS